MRVAVPRLCVRVCVFRVSIFSPLPALLVERALLCGAVWR